MPRGFRFPEAWGREPELWVPLALTPENNTRGSHSYWVMARLKPEVTLRTAQTEMETIALRLAQQDPETNQSIGARIVALREQLFGSLRTMAVVLQLAVGFILLIACANVANLLLAQSVTRHKEIAIRSAMGADRMRLLRQLMAESVLLFVLGGAAGVALAVWGKNLLVASSPAGYLPGAGQIRVDGWVLGFTFATALLTGIVFSLGPGLHALKLDVNESLKEGGGRHTGGAKRQRLRTSLVVLEVALTSFLTVGAGLMVRSLRALLEVNPGFNPENILTAQVALPEAKYSKPGQVIAFFRNTLERIQGLPGVTAAAFSNKLPLLGGWNGTVLVEGQQLPRNVWEGPLAEFSIVTPGYFRAARIPLLRGQEFSERDTEEALKVVIVNEAFARRFWPNQDPMGKHLSFERNPPDWRKVIGVVGDVRQWGLSNPPLPETYVPHTQMPESEMYLVVRSPKDPATLGEVIRKQILQVDSEEPIYRVRTGEQIVAQSASVPRFQTLLVTIFAVLALALAAVGIYGTISYAVSQQMHQIGIRMALGAQARDVVLLVVGQGMAPALAGLGTGLAAAFALTRFLASLLFGVGATDTATFAGVALLLAAVAFLASYLPARRALRVDPMVVLRYE